jgi:hypothetical protein
MASNRYEPGFSRRSFLRTTLVGGATLATGTAGQRLASVTTASVAGAGEDFPFMERSIMELQAAMASGPLTSPEVARL